MAVGGVALIDPSNRDTRAAGEVVCESRYSTSTYQHYHPGLVADMPRSACSCRNLLGSDGPMAGATSTSTRSRSLNVTLQCIQCGFDGS